MQTQHVHRNNGLFISRLIQFLFISIFLLNININLFANAAPMTCGLVPPNSSTNSNSGSSSGTGSTSDGSNSGGGNGTSDDSGICTRAVEQVVVTSGWYPGWLASQVPPSSLSWEKYTHLTYAFALTDPDASKIVLNTDDERVLPEFVSAAKSHGVKALLSIGGWTGSRFFSTAVATPENRTVFVNAVMGLVRRFDLDGIDFDWEYPNKQGLGCNIINPSDSENFLSFIQELRVEAGDELYLSAAVGISPFNGLDGTPLSDVSGFARELDHIAIMGYDIWGPWATGIGPNAPLDDSCSPSPAGSANSAVKAWTGAGFPSNKIALGVAAYGHSFRVSDQNSALGSGGSLNLYSAFTSNINPLVPADGGGVDICGNPVPNGGGTDVYDFKQIGAAGFLNTDGSVAQGISYTFDNCSQTPFVYNPNSGVVISYDDQTSFAAKGKFINDNGLKGFAMWHVVGDSNDILLDSISGAMDIQDGCSQ